MSGTYQVIIVLRERELKDGGWTGKVNSEVACESGLATEDKEEAVKVFREASDALRQISIRSNSETKPHNGSPGYATMGEYAEAHARAKKQSMEGIQ